MSAPPIVVPRSAVQVLGERHVVYLPAKDDEGKFVQRVVTLGPPVGDGYAVLAGLSPGERLVTRGTYEIRLASSSSAVPAHGHVH